MSEEEEEDKYVFPVHAPSGCYWVVGPAYTSSDSYSFNDVVDKYGFQLYLIMVDDEGVETEFDRVYISSDKVNVQKAIQDKAEMLVIYHANWMQSQALYGTYK